MGSPSDWMETNPRYNTNYSWPNLALENTLVIPSINFPDHALEFRRDDVTTFFEPRTNKNMGNL